MRTVVVLTEDTREGLAFVESHRLAGADATAPVQYAEMGLLDGGDTTDEDVVLPEPPIGADSRFVVVVSGVDARRTGQVLRRYLPLGAREPEWLGWESNVGPGDRVELWYAAGGYAIALRAHRCYEYRDHAPLQGEPDFLFGVSAGDRGLRLASPCVGYVKPLEPLTEVNGHRVDPVNPTELYGACERQRTARVGVGAALALRGGGEMSFEGWVALCVEFDECYPSEVDAVVRHVRGRAELDAPWYRRMQARVHGGDSGSIWRTLRGDTAALAAKARARRSEGGR